MQKLLLLLLASACLVSCGTGYQKKDGKWNWVTWDEGNGKRSRELNVDSSTFEILKGGEYARDSSQAYYKGWPIDGASGSGFVLLGNDYASDQNSVFIRAKLIHNAKADSFELLEPPYARDDTNVFCGNIPLVGANPANFVVTKSSNSHVSTPLVGFRKKHPQYAWMEGPEGAMVTWGSIAEGRSGEKRFKGFLPVDP